MQKRIYDFVGDDVRILRERLLFNHLIANDSQNCVLSIRNLFADCSLSESVTKIDVKIEVSRMHKTRVRGEPKFYNRM